MNDPLPWGWHEDGPHPHVWERCSLLPILPNVGEHDDVALTMPEHDAMRDIAAHWGVEVPCIVIECASAACWVQHCHACRAMFAFCRYDRELIATRQANGVTVRCHVCDARQPSPLLFRPL